MKSRFLPILLTGVVVASPELDARVWTNDSGSTISGNLVEVREGELDLLLSDGRRVTVPRKILSGVDNQYADEWQRRARDGEGPPPEDQFPQPQQIPDANAVKKVVPTNWTAPWPKKSGYEGVIMFKVLQQLEGHNVYESDNFRIESPKPLDRTELDALFIRFESSLATLSTLPFNLRLAMVPPGRYVIRVYFDDEEWEKNEGVPHEKIGVSGTHFIVRLDRKDPDAPVSIELQKDRPIPDFSYLKPIHVVTHWVMQFMGKTYWLNEGLAAYMENLPEKDGMFFYEHDVAMAARAIPRTIRKSRLNLPPLEKILRQEGAPAGAEREQLRMKAGALLATVFFIRMDRGGKDMKNLRHYLQQIQREEKGNPVELLLDGRTWEELEMEMADAWRPHRVILTFDRPQTEKP